MCIVSGKYGILLQPPSNTRRILIADSEALLHGAALTILEKAGVEVDHARDLAEASTLLGTRPYVAMLIDAASTDLDVAELRRLMQLSQPRPVVVVASSETGPPFDATLVSLVVRKPYDVQMMIGVLLACGTAAISPVMFDASNIVK